MTVPLPVGAPDRDDAPARRPVAAGAAPTPDWAFLTDDTDLGRVALDGPGSRPPASAESVPAGSALADWRPGDPTFDTIVLRRPDAGAVRRAATALSEGGTIRVEGVAGTRRWQIAKVLAGAGFTVRWWWHRPDLDATWAIVGLQRPAAAAAVLRGIAGRHRRGAPEAALARSGLARWLAGAVALTATRTAESTPVAAGDPAAPVDALLTPRFQSSRAILGITMTARGDRVATVAKIARSGADDAAIRQEAAALGAFRERCRDPQASPSSHGLVERGGRLVLVEAGAEGRPLDRRLVRRDPAAALSAGITWLQGVPIGPATAPHSDGRAEGLLGTALDCIAGLEGPRADGRLGAVDRAGRLLHELGGRPVPVVFEHGDLSHPNIFRRPDGRLTVVDWERAHERGFPLHDLTLFTAYVVESAARPRHPQGLVAALREAGGPAGWARPLVDHHLTTMGVDPADAALLELAAWTRYMAHLATVPQRLEQPAPHRGEVLWLDALRRTEESLA